MEPPPVAKLSRAESTAMASARRARNLALLGVLLGIVAMFYAIALVKLSGH